MGRNLIDNLEGPGGHYGRWALDLKPATHFALVAPPAASGLPPPCAAVRERNGSAGWAGGPGRQEGAEKFSNECVSKNRDGSRAAGSSVHFSLDGEARRTCLPLGATVRPFG